MCYYLFTYHIILFLAICINFHTQGSDDDDDDDEEEEATDDEMQDFFDLVRFICVIIAC